MRLILILLSSLFLLSSCFSSESSTPTSAPSPYPSIPLGVSTEIGTPSQNPTGGSYSAKGTEPFWSVSVKPGTATVSRPGETDISETTFTTTEDDK